MGFNVLANFFQQFYFFLISILIALDECCKRHKGLWSKEAEDMLFEHFGGTQI